MAYGVPTRVSRVALTVGPVAHAGFSADLSVAIPSPNIEIIAVAARSNASISNMAIRLYKGDEFDGTTYVTSDFLAQIDCACQENEANASTSYAGYKQCEPPIPYLNEDGASIMYVIVENEDGSNDAGGIQLDFIVTQNPWRPIY